MALQYHTAIRHPHRNPGSNHDLWFYFHRSIHVICDLPSPSEWRTPGTPSPPPGKSISERGASSLFWGRPSCKFYKSFSTWQFPWIPSIASSWSWYFCSFNLRFPFPLTLSTPSLVYPALLGDPLGPFRWKFQLNSNPLWLKRAWVRLPSPRPSLGTDCASAIFSTWWPSLLPSTATY